MGPVVGREAELVIAAAALDEARPLVLGGPAGIGKTALARAVADRSGRTTLWSTATRSAASIALGPLAALLEVIDLEPGRPVDVLARIGPALDARLPDALVVVDDAHLLDDVSAAAVHRLATTGRPVVVTVRTGGPVPDAVSALWRDGPGERIDLAPLDGGAMAALIEELLPGEVEPATERRLIDLSGGHPLYARELILAGQADGWLRVDGGVWRGRDGPMPSGERLRELIAARVEGCSDEQVTALELVALAERLPTTTLQRLVGARVCEELERRQLVRVVRSPTGLLALVDHPMIGESVRAGLGELRRQALATRLLDALTGDRAESELTLDEVLQVGQLALLSATPSPDHLLAAARAAAAVYDFGAAADLAAAAVDHGGGVEAMLVLGDMVTADRRYDEADEILSALLERGDLEPEQRALGTVALSTARLWGRGPDEAEALLRSVQLDPVNQSEVDAHLGWILGWGGKADAAAAILEPLVSAQGAVHPRTRLRAAATCAGAFGMQGRSADAIALIEANAAAALALATELPLVLPQMIVCRGYAQWSLGRILELDEEVALMLEAADVEDLEQRALWSIMAGLAALVRGRPSTARAALEPVVIRLGDHDTARMQGWASALAAVAAAMSGDLQAAEAHLARSCARPHGSLGLYDLERRWAEARLHAARGDRHRALEAAQRAATDLAGRGHRAGEAVLLDLTARLGDRTAATRLAELADLTASPLVAAWAEHADAASASDPDRLLACAATLQAMGHDLDAADACAAAARAAWKDGRRGTAFAATERARALQATCEGAPLAQPLPSTESHLPLTERELDVAILAALGLSNQAIAERLELSVRTVGNHLYRAYGKAGVSGRAELAQVLRASGHTC